MNQTKLPKAAAGLASLSSIQQASTWGPLGFLALCLSHSPLPVSPPCVVSPLLPSRLPAGLPRGACAVPIRDGFLVWLREGGRSHISSY